MLNMDGAGVSKGLPVLSSSARYTVKSNEVLSFVLFLTVYPADIVVIAQFSEKLLQADSLVNIGEAPEDALAFANVTV